MHVSAIIAAGGRGARFGADAPKQLVHLAGRPILQRSVEAFLRSPRVDDVVVALPEDLVRNPPDYLRAEKGRLLLVPGGVRRQDSVANAFRAVEGRADLVVIHDAARPLVTGELIARTIDAAAQSGAAIAALAATDTVKRGSADRVIVGTIPREEVFLAQTPQAFRTDVLRQALALGMGADATDEARLVELAGFDVSLVEGERTNIKITSPDDMRLAERWLGGQVQTVRIGNGYDLHRLVAGRPLVLGGVTIPFDRGLFGHSDADVVCHAVTDAILGAAALGDIGQMFPDTDPAWRGADSLVLLARAAAVVGEAGYRVANIDVTVIAERPKLLPHLAAMRGNVARAVGVDVAQISIKGKTNESVDAIGAGDAIASHAVALLNPVA